VQPDQEILQPGRHKIYVKLHRHPNIVLVIIHLVSVIVKI